MPMEILASNPETHVASQTAELPRSWLLLLGLCLLVPHLFWGPTPGVRGSINIGLPRVYSGDEPHYLIMINSLIREGDLDLADNYRRVHQGSNEAGKASAGSRLDPHVAWVTRQGSFRWWDVYDMKNWNRDPQGHPVPKVKPGKELLAESLPTKYYSWHGWGLPIVLAPVAFLFRQTEVLESVMLICSGLSVIGAMYFFHMLIKPLTQNSHHAFLVVAAAFLATPVWAYGRTLFTEPYLLFCVTGAFALYLRKRSGFWAGILIGIGVLIKPAIAVVAIPLVLDCLLQHRWKQLILMVIPCFGFSLLVLAGNQLMYGSYSSFPNFPARFFPLQSTIGHLFSTEHGLFFCRPYCCGSARWMA